MQTFDSALFKLYKEGRISLDEALRNADSANNLRLKISLSEGKTSELGQSSSMRINDAPEKPAIPASKMSLSLE
jgi:twitching motility protein PilU